MKSFETNFLYLFIFRYFVKTFTNFELNHIPQIGIGKFYGKLKSNFNLTKSIQHVSKFFNLLLCFCLCVWLLWQNRMTPCYNWVIKKQKGQKSQTCFFFKQRHLRGQFNQSILLLISSETTTKTMLQERGNEYDGKV